ncbi:MAG: hypothetical protein WEG36_10705 [Gemmatimonadota bacterium]
MIPAPRLRFLHRCAAMLAAAAGAGCGLLFPGNPDPAPARSPSAALPADLPPDAEIPVGMGTLLQEEISLALRRGELQILVTPLEESIVRLTAPDTYERLSALGRGYQDIFVERTGSAVPFELFLVSLFSEAVEVAFEPEALNLVNRALRYRPVDIRPLTPDWDSRRVLPRQTSMAVYAFPGDLDFQRPTEVEYQEVRSREWERVLPLLERERSRLRSRTPAPN